MESPTRTQQEKVMMGKGIEAWEIRIMSKRLQREQMRSVNQLELRKK